MSLTKESQAAIQAAVIEPCPFCGDAGHVDASEGNGVLYFTIGCRTRGCYGESFGQMVGRPFDAAAKWLEAWNRRSNVS